MKREKEKEMIIKKKKCPPYPKWGGKLCILAKTKTKIHMGSTWPLNLPNLTKFKQNKAVWYIDENITLY